MKIIEAPGPVYYVEVIDTDSHLPSWTKIWDTQEIPAHIIAHCLADYLTPKHRPGPHIIQEFKRRV